jgi:hypothetical protein
VVLDQVGTLEGIGTEQSLRARAMTIDMEAPYPELWFCHMFSSKALAHLVRMCEDGLIGEDEDVLFWATKTKVQPAKQNSQVFDRPGIEKLTSFMQKSGLCDDETFWAQRYTTKAV